MNHRERVPEKCFDCPWFDRTFSFCRLKICKKKKDMLDHMIDANNHLKRINLIKEENE